MTAKGEKRAVDVYAAAGLAAKESRQLGLNMGDQWAVDNAVKAAGLFQNKALMPMAAIMATVHPHAFDYIQQAPVLVLAVMNGQKRMDARKRHFMLTQWKSASQNQLQLRKLMAFWRLPQPMRKIQAAALRVHDWPVMLCLSKVKPSTLSQAIPPKGQKQWIAALGAWILTFQRRRGRGGFPGEFPFFEWCAAHWRDDKDVRMGAPGPAADMADFAYSQLTRFNPVWTWQQAAAARDRWHADCGKMKYGADVDRQMDATPFPDELKVGDYSFHALRSPADLIADGAAMHHCVGSYGADLLRGGLRLISCRRDGKRIATAEFRQDVVTVSQDMAIEDGPTAVPANAGDRFGWRMGQFKGLANSVPPTQAVLAMRDYLRLVRASIKLDKREEPPCNI